MKHVESQNCEELEVGRAILGVLADFLVDAPEVMGELLLADGFSADPDPLVGRHQVGRGEEAGLETLAEQDRLREGAGRALALGAAHVDGPELVQLFKGHAGLVQVSV